MSVITAYRLNNRSTFGGLLAGLLLTGGDWSGGYWPRTDWISVRYAARIISPSLAHVLPTFLTIGCSHEIIVPLVLLLFISCTIWCESVAVAGRRLHERGPWAPLAKWCACNRDEQGHQPSGVYHLQRFIHRLYQEFHQHWSVINLRSRSPASTK